MLGDPGAFVTTRTNRNEMIQKLLGIPGRHLVLIRDIDAKALVDGWVWNEADVDQSRIVWARSIDPVADQRAIGYWAGRSVWTVFASANPPRLVNGSGPDLAAR